MGTLCMNARQQLQKQKQRKPTPQRLDISPWQSATGPTVLRRPCPGCCSRPAVLGRPCPGCWTRPAVLGRPCPGCCSRPAVLGRPCPGCCSRPAVLGRPCPGCCSRPAVLGRPCPGCCTRLRSLVSFSSAATEPIARVGVGAPKRQHSTVMTLMPVAPVTLWRATAQFAACYCSGCCRTDILCRHMDTHMTACMRL